MILFNSLGAGTAKADIKDPWNYVFLTHELSVAEPWIEFCFITRDKSGYDDVLSQADIYIGWDGENKIKVFDAGRNGDSWNSTNTNMVQVVHGKVSLEATATVSGFIFASIPEKDLVVVKALVSAKTSILECLVNGR